MSSDLGGGHNLRHSTSIVLDILDRLGGRYADSLLRVASCFSENRNHLLWHGSEAAKRCCGVATHGSVCVLQRSD